MRHGALPPNPERRFVGQRDIALSAFGREQAAAWRQRLADIPFAAVISSDLSRCVESAQLVKGERDLPLVLEPVFRELSLGAWEGRTPDEIEELFPGAYAERGKDLARFRPEGGESFADLAERVLPVFDAWTRHYAGQNMLIVAHAGVKRVILAGCMARALRHVLDIPQPYACCVQLYADLCAVRHVS
jgi:probable phosphoglycerate mutase